LTLKALILLISQLDRADSAVSSRAVHLAMLNLCICHLSGRKPLELMRKIKRWLSVSWTLTRLSRLRSLRMTLLNIKRLKSIYRRTSPYLLKNLLLRNKSFKKTSEVRYYLQFKLQLAELKIEIKITNGVTQRKNLSR
jgi:hypothetical protein